MKITQEMVEAAAWAMIANMFAEHELPVDDELWRKYCGTARAALVAALAIRSTPDIESKT